MAADLHLNAFDTNPFPSSYHTDTNWPLLRESLAAMRKIDPKPDVVVLAGDFLAHNWGGKAHDAGFDATAAAEQTMRNIATEFNRAFPDAQFVIAMGNNDDPCGDYRTGPNSKYLAAVARAWEPLVNRHGGAPRFLRDFSYAGYYTVRLRSGERAVVLNDVYWSLFYRGCGRAQNVPAQELAWFGRTLRALKPGDRAVAIMHIPPGVDATATLIAHRFIVVPYWRENERAAFTGELTRNRAKLAFALAAHAHRMDFRTLGGVPMLVLPSISPIYSNNPTFVTMTIGAQDALQEYRAYSYDLQGGGWSQTFDYNAAFGERTFLDASLERVHDRIGSDEGFRMQWARAVTGDSYVWNDVRRSWRAYWCAQTESGARYITCAGDQRRTAVLPLLAVAAGAVVLLLAVWYSRRRRWKAKPEPGE